MYKLYILSFFAVLINLTIANANTRDSIGIENNNGKKVIVHQTVAKDTYYSIGRRYNIPPKDIMAFNDNKYLQIGVIIKVPTNLPFSEKTPATPSTATTQAPPEGNLIEHAVQKKENLNMLAEKYGTTVNEIKRINNLRSINLQIGQILKIPANNIAEETTPVETVTQPVVTTTVKPEPVKQIQQVSKPAAAPVTIAAPPATVPSEEFVEHTVASNETIYSIATRYKLTIDQLKAKNNLTDNGLRVGQKLLIKGQYPVKQAYVPPTTADDDDKTDSTLKKPALRLPASRYGLNEIDEKGTATWITDPDLDPTKMLVLHRTAPIGGIIKITNPMSNRVTFAKVVGKFTENETTKDVIIVMTKAVADALGALDKRFFCNITYGGQENEQK
ncbi:LysM peptidoglycan-binding domain-containing protein [Pedobacter psychroterrae]|uniref:LysM peptidoglycan-binding domain-containing protein n=1 Tax=Pedobacter psychroterrae TaxID=2530453 RepID=A0A4R0NMM4_9SPHI|nr:LysM peptidoglycan-binding domain-containing protein [Pedobacter psychroterrae]TCD01469.1 LysM peptidoglycan-binding domain-containing protein [Pedobacter psychroterrae]